MFTGPYGVVENGAWQEWLLVRPEHLTLAPQAPALFAAAWRDILPLVVNGSVNPIVARVFPFAEAGEGLHPLIDDRPFGKVVLAG
jgi:NADPH2:quinone reductase